MSGASRAAGEPGKAVGARSRRGFAEASNPPGAAGTSMARLPATDGVGERIGTVFHFFPRAGAAQLELEAGSLRVGDRIRIRGHGKDFVQEVFSMEVDRVARARGEEGELVAIAVMQPVHEKDEVFRLS